MSLFLRQPSKVIYLICIVVATVVIPLPWWFIYYSWPSNRPRKSWSLRRAINVRIMRQVTHLPMKLGVVVDGRDLSLEVPQKELKAFNARFVWVPELEEEDIVGIVAEHAERVGVKSIAIPAYWILKEGLEWSPAHEKALRDEKTVLYFHGGAFVVSPFLFVPRLCTNSHFRVGLPTRLTRRRLFPKGGSDTPHLSPEHCRSITGSVLDLLSPKTHFRVR